jgi:hypothetical protein
MAVVAIGVPHAVAHAPAVTVPVPFPPAGVGHVELIAMWNEWVPYGGTYLPFQLEAGDYMIVVPTPTSDPSSKLGIWGLELKYYGGGNTWVYLSTGVGLYHILDTEWQIELYHSGYGNMKVFIAVYRGLEETDRVNGYQQAFQWNNQRDELSLHRESIHYNAPEAKVAAITYAKMAPELSTFSYSPDHGHVRDVILAEDYHIEENRQVTLEFTSIDDPSPTEDLWAYATAAWDPEFTTEGWGTGDIYTFIFQTQQVDFLPEDPGNPAPAGGAHLPIRGD